MSKLGFILRDLLRQAEATPGAGTRPVKLQKGLSIAAKVEAGAATLCLYRDADMAPSQEEAITCGEHLGWYGPVITEGRTRTGLPCLFVREAPKPREGFCPGVPLAFLPEHLPDGVLLGLPVAGDWVTIRREGDALTWCSRQSSGMHTGSRPQLLAWIAARREGRAA